MKWFLSFVILVTCLRESVGNYYCGCWWPYYQPINCVNTCSYTNGWNCCNPPINPPIYPPPINPPLLSTNAPPSSLEPTPTYQPPIPPIYLPSPTYRPPTTYFPYPTYRPAYPTYQQQNVSSTNNIKTTWTNLINNKNSVNNSTNINSRNINTIIINGKKISTDRSIVNPVTPVAIIRPIPTKVPIMLIATSETPIKCCIIKSPRRCKNNNGKWTCNHTSVNRCGPFCTKDVIILRPNITVFRDPILLIPPLIDVQVIDWDRNEYDDYGKI